MNEIQIFQNQEFGAIRTLKNEQGEAMFCGKDVAEALGYNNPLKAIRNHVDSEDKGVNELGTPGGKQKIIFINESGLYALILSSKPACSMWHMARSGTRPWRTLSDGA